MRGCVGTCEVWGIGLGIGIGLYDGFSIGSSGVLVSVSADSRKQEFPWNRMDIPRS